MYYISIKLLKIIKDKNRKFYLKKLLTIISSLEARNKKPIKLYNITAKPM
jgi:hypothetical protein